MRRIPLSTLILATIIVLSTLFAVTYYIKTKLMQPPTLEMEGATVTISTGIALVNTETGEEIMLNFTGAGKYEYRYKVQNIPLSKAKIKVFPQIKWKAKDVANLRLVIKNLRVVCPTTQQSDLIESEYIITLCSGKIYKVHKTGTKTLEFKTKKVLKDILPQAEGTWEVYVYYEVELRANKINPDGSISDKVISAEYPHNPVQKKLNLDVMAEYIPEPELVIEEATVSGWDLDTGELLIYNIYVNYLRFFDIFP